MTTLRPSELQCQRTIVEAAHITGWRVHAERAALARSGLWSTPIQGDAGFPDLILVKGHKLLAVELKRKPNRATDAQKAWLTALDDVLGVTAILVMVPDDMDDFIQKVLAA